MKTEIWNGHNIRFVEKAPGDWWAAAKDISTALGYVLTTNMTKRIDPSEKDIAKCNTLGGDQEMINQLINTLKADVGGIKKLFIEENDDAFELYAVPQNETHEARMLILERFLKLRKEHSMANVEMICCFEDSDVLRGDNIREIL